jgi:hypothetical protein
MLLESFDRFILQVHLNELAKTRSKDRVLQMRAYVRDSFVEAGSEPTDRGTRVRTSRGRPPESRSNVTREIREPRIGSSRRPVGR